MGRLGGVLTFVAVAGAAFGLGYLASNAWEESGPSITQYPSGASAGPLFAANLADPDGKIHALAQWKGKVLVVNFWATWCDPCRAEIPEFIEMQAKYQDRGLLFVGIAIDQAARVKAFRQDFGINYPVLVAEANGFELSERAGNRAGGIPFTAVIDREGNIVASRAGRITGSQLERVVVPLLPAN